MSIIQRLRRMITVKIVDFHDGVTYTRTGACVDNYFHRVDGTWHQFLPQEDGSWEIDGLVYRRND